MPVYSLIGCRGARFTVPANDVDSETGVPIVEDGAGTDLEGMYARSFDLASTEMLSLGGVGYGHRRSSHDGDKTALMGRRGRSERWHGTGTL
jgi:hypothetical protein